MTSSMRSRLLLGPVLIAALVGVAWLDERVDGLAWPARVAEWTGRPTAPPGLVILAVLAVIAIAGSRELGAIMRQKGVSASRRIMTAAAVVGLGVSALVQKSVDGAHAVEIVASAAAAVLLTSLVYHARGRRFEGVVAAAGGTMLAFVYLGLMLGFVLAVRREYSAWVVVAVLMIIKSCDIGAYFTGTAIGRHRLIPWLSPGKTWEGLAGGLVVSGATGALCAWLLSSELGAGPLGAPVQGGVAGVLMGLSGQAGDLVASLLKRDAGLKDSSRALPGFGGVLDVVDSPLLGVPVAYWWLRWMAS